MADIFVSCARTEDDRALRLIAALSRHGWVASRDRAAGVDMVDSAKAVIVVWSASSLANSMVLADAVRALSRGTLVMAHADACRPPSPLLFMACTDLRAWDGESLPQPLSDALAALLAGEPESVPDDERARQALIASRARELEAEANRAGVPLAVFAAHFDDLADTGDWKLDDSKAIHQWVRSGLAFDDLGGGDATVADARRHALEKLDAGDLDAAHACIDGALSAARRQRTEQRGVTRAHVAQNRIESALLLDRAGLNELRLRHEDAVADCEAAAAIWPAYGAGLLFEILYQRGMSSRQNEMLLGALEELRGEIGRTQSLYDWSSFGLLQRQALALGDMLTNLGYLVDDRRRREMADALDALRKKLMRPTARRSPEEIALASIGVANVLVEAEVPGGATWHLGLAEDLYALALRILPRPGTPHQLAVARTNLGNALTRRAEAEFEKALSEWRATLEAAVEAYRAVQVTWRRDIAPLEWARIQNNLSGTLRLLALRSHDTRYQDEAIGAARAALEEWTRERVPMDWAAAQDSLGQALLDAGRLDEAEAAFRAALEVFTPAETPLEHEMVTRHLERTLAESRERRSG